MAALFVDEATVAAAVAAHGRRRRHRRRQRARRPPSISGAARRGAGRHRRPRPRRRRLAPPRRLGRRPLAARRADPRRLRGGRRAASRCGRPQIGLVSSMTGAFVDEELTGRGYWRRHLRAPVRFAAVVRHAPRRRAAPRSSRSAPTRPCSASASAAGPTTSATWVPSLRRDTDEPAQLATALATLYAAGVRRRLGAPSTRRRSARRGWRCRPTRGSASAYWSRAPPGRGAVRPTPAWPAAVAAAEAQAEQGPLDLQLETYPERWARARPAGHRRSSCAALRDARPLHPRRRAPPPSPTLVDRGRVAAGHEHLVAERWLDHLADDGLLDARRRRLRGRPSAGRTRRSTDCWRGPRRPSAATTRCSPTSAAAATSLAAVVAGDESAAGDAVPRRLLRDGRLPLRRAGRWPATSTASSRAAVTAAAAAPSRAGRCASSSSAPAPAARRRPCCPPCPPTRTSYTFTDVSDFFLARAAERFAAHPFVRYAAARHRAATRTSRASRPGRYDVVVAANVLHATRDLDVTLGPRPLAAGTGRRAGRLRGHRSTRAGSTSPPG